MARLDGKDRGLFERPKGSKIWWIRYTDAEGQEHREKVGSKEAARDIYRQRKTEIRLDKFDPERVTRRKRWTVAKMLAHYREKRKALGPKNQGEDQRYVDLWTARFGTLELEQLKPSHLETWREERAREEVKPATINRALTYLKVYFNLAVRDKLCKDNPVKSIKALQENNERTRYLDPDTELPRLKAELRPEEWDLVEFAIATGMRQSEQFGLRWENLTGGGGIVKIPEAKSGKGRMVYLNDEAQAVLARQRQRDPGSPWVFPVPNRPDLPRNAHNFYNRVFKPACARAGILDFCWHDLRHTFGSLLTMKGAHQRALQELLGHATGRMTERYSHLAPGHLAGVVNMLSGNLRESQPPSEPAPKPAPAKKSNSLAGAQK